ncbi:response regulator [Cohnella endophytica]|uniref:Response regulator n=1 Tax=Cohnella endophytica TaxID=2419778 RepID=A0A494Y400_9BACL|nr:response regulator [Cohnella endophytica]RKP56185.1 response regulator [Cohnella endophytica]
MIYKALIVDDEPIIRYGLASTVDWEGAGVELVGEAGNGEAALGMVSEREVDILITDIKMPMMDGLELIRLAKLSRPHIKAILISSYSDFDYARQAVQLGVVVDYLLKPTMEPEDVTRLLIDCRRRLEDELSLEKNSSLYSMGEKQRKRQGFATEMNRALNGQAADLVRYAGDFPGPYVLSIWRADEGQGIDTAIEKLGALLPDSVVCATKESELALLLPDRTGGGAAAMAASLVRDAHIALREDADRIRFTIGISPPFYRLDRLPEAYAWAESAFEHAFFGGKGKCYDGEIRRQNGEAGAAPQLSSKQEEANELLDRFSRKLAGSDDAACERALRQLFELWRSRAVAPGEILKQAGDALLRIASGQFYLKAEEKLELLMEENERLRKAGALEEVIAIVIAGLRDGRRNVDSLPLTAVSEDTGGAHAIQTALVYIQEHYRSELSLREVADSVHMSRNYFSEQFKRRTGFNFIDYVIRLRIRYAKHLLETTMLKVFDIGIHSGFNNSKHFLKMFKRESGCTPAEYRSRSQHGEEGET